MLRLEIHPGDGGADAEQFATELAQAISAYTHRPIEAEGRVLVLHRL